MAGTNDATTHDWTERLSAYLDGDLPPEVARATDLHLAECPACRAAVADLEAIMAAAPGYGGQAPARDLWPAIADGIDSRRAVTFPGQSTGRGRRFSLVQLIAASVAFAVIGGGSALMLYRGDARTPAAVAVHGAEGGAALIPAALAPRADSAFDGAVSDLEQALAQGRDRLDPATVRIIEENLAVIDRAIAEARDAIARDPANAWLQNAMANNMRRKLDLLRSATDAIAATEL